LRDHAVAQVGAKEAGPAGHQNALRASKGHGMNFTAWG
jgi:hypothetical protein